MELGLGLDLDLVFPTYPFFFLLLGEILGIADQGSLAYRKR